MGWGRPRRRRRWRNIDGADDGAKTHFGSKCWGKRRGRDSTLANREARVTGMPVRSRSVSGRGGAGQLTPGDRLYAPRGGDTTVLHVAEQTSAQKEDSARASMELVSY